MSNGNEWAFLAHELLVQVLSYLDAKSIARATAVCRWWRQAACDEFLWTQLVVERWTDDFEVRKLLQSAHSDDRGVYVMAPVEPQQQPLTPSTSTITTTATSSSLSSPSTPTLSLAAAASSLLSFSGSALSTSPPQASLAIAMPSLPLSPSQQLLQQELHSSYSPSAIHDHHDVSSGSLPNNLAKRAMLQSASSTSGTSPARARPPPLSNTPSLKRLTGGVGGAGVAAALISDSGSFDIYNAAPSTRSQPASPAQSQPSTPVVSSSSHGASGTPQHLRSSPSTPVLSLSTTSANGTTPTVSRVNSTSSASLANRQPPTRRSQYALPPNHPYVLYGQVHEATRERTIMRYLHCMALQNGSAAIRFSPSRQWFGGAFVLPEYGAPKCCLSFNIERDSASDLPPLFLRDFATHASSCLLGSLSLMESNDYGQFAGVWYDAAPSTNRRRSLCGGSVVTERGYA